MALTQLSVTVGAIPDCDDCYAATSSLTTNNAAFSHYGDALAHLRRSVQDPISSTEDATLFAIATLVGFDVRNASESS